MTSLFDLHGRVAVVTGGSRGIGRGIALGLAGAGADVAIWARDEAACAAAAGEIEALGVRSLAVPCDVSSPDAVRSACARTVAELGRIDVCFANAGFGTRLDPLDSGLEEWRRVLDVNLDGTFLTLREVARHMVERGGGGKLVAVSSIVEIFGASHQAHYAASKGAIGALVRTLAVELARHDIQVNNLQPGWIDTDATQGMQAWKPLNDAVLRRTPARRWGRPEDFQGIAVYLASDASRYHTGDTIRVDGGYTVF